MTGAMKWLCLSILILGTFSIAFHCDKSQAITVSTNNSNLISTTTVKNYSTNIQPTPRTVFVQLFEWPWKDIAKECETYLGPNGFAAVQISPPQEHLTWENHPWWERYQPVSYKIQSRSGNEDEFIDMVQRCQNAGVDIYADVIFNHMTGVPEGVGFAGTSVKHYEYAGLYNYDDFHHCGRNGNDNIVNYFDLYELYNCELLDLADLKTESPSVQNKIAQYLNHLVDLGVKGFRIDAAKHMPAGDIHNILQRVKSNPYVLQELILNGEPLDVDAYINNGDITVFAYPFALGSAFKNKSLPSLRPWINSMVSSEDAIVMVDNHDLQRSEQNYNYLLSYVREPQLFRLAQVFMLTWPYGYPQIFSGYRFSNFDQGPALDQNLKTLPILDSNNNCTGAWTCEHRLSEVAPLVMFRNETNNSFYVSNWWSNGSDQIAFGRGKDGFVVINADGDTLTKTFSTSLPAGTYCDLLSPEYNHSSRSCSQGIRVQSNGETQLKLKPYSAVVLLKKIKL